MAIGDTDHSGAGCPAPKFPHAPGTFIFCLFRECDWEMKVAEYPPYMGLSMPPNEVDRYVTLHLLDEHGPVIRQLYEALYV